MHRVRRLVKIEMDVEFFSCVHAVSIILLYGFPLWLNHTNAVSFGIIFQMVVLGYVMSWTQKVLFLEDKTYQSWEYRLREVMWSLLPFAELILASLILGWFRHQPWQIILVFYLIMALYFVMIWIFIKIFYQEDTEEMNRMLRQRRGNEKGGKA